MIYRKEFVLCKENPLKVELSCENPGKLPQLEVFCISWQVNFAIAVSLESWERIDIVFTKVSRELEL